MMPEMTPDVILQMQIADNKLCTGCWKEKSTRAYQISMTTEIEDAESFHREHSGQLLKIVHWCYECVKFKSDDWFRRIKREAGRINE